MPAAAAARTAWVAPAPDASQPGTANLRTTLNGHYLQQKHTLLDCARTNILYCMEVTE